MILHVVEGESAEDTIMGLKGFLHEHYNESLIAICEESKWKDSNEFILNLSELSSLQDSETQF